ncbi:MAG: HAMP domain-containing protein [Chloroflexi bacterium]|nr:HAMP domain-containing protein [Chloroflexota bacterium]
MRSITVKLTLAFVIASVIGAILVAVIVRQVTLSEFDRLVVESTREAFAAYAVQYYSRNGSFAGFDRWLPDQLRRGGPRGRQPLDPNAFRAFALVDATGRVIWPAGGLQPGQTIPPERASSGMAVQVNGETIAVVLTVGETPPLNPQEQRYIRQTDRAALLAAGIAGTVGIVLSVFLARSLTRPIRDLTAATRGLAGGDLRQQVPVRTRDELGDLAVAFNQMSADLDRSNRLRRQMTADIAHDLRTPLTVINGYLEGLRDGVVEPTPERFDIMHAEAANLMRLIEDLRTLSLADADELSLKRQAIQPRDLLERTAAAHAVQAETHGIRLRVETDPELPPVIVDRDQMARVLGNLVTNALRYTPDGGLVMLSARQANGTVELAVEDTGTGIAPEDLPHIFERFYRVDKSRTSGESGLGLAIARSVVEAHGGTIRVRSQLGQGTQFVIALNPAAPRSGSAH